LRWDTSGDLATAFEAINRAHDWGSFTTAVGSFAVPSMNIVYADIDGNVGYAMSGKLPVRANGDGTLPGDGNSGAGWRGSIEPGALPRIFNPASGPIYSANNEIDRGFSGLITRDWTAGFRASRLRDQLTNAQGVDLDAMAALQNDRHSAAADLVLAGLDAAIKTGRTRESGRHRWRFSNGSRNGIASSTRPVVSAKRSKTRCGGGRSWTKWTSVVREVLRMESAESPRACIRSSRIASRAGSTTSRRWRSAVARRHFPARISDAEISCRRFRQRGNATGIACTPPAQPSAAT
jgi:hypothetical protein